MSMLSAMCDRLRERAKVLRQGRWSDGAEDAKMMDDAADTIWELRCKLSDMVDDRERARVAEAENAKLRELAKEACEMARTFYNLGGTFNDLDDLLCEAAELGVEVGVDE